MVGVSATAWERWGRTSTHGGEVRGRVSNTSARLQLAPAATPVSPAFAQVFAEHAPRVWRTLRNLGVPESDLADASQETFVIVYRKLATFRGDSSLKTWVCGI